MCVCVIQGFAAGEGNSELEVLRQENEALKAQMAQLSAQLLDVSSNTNFFCFYDDDDGELILWNKLNGPHSKVKKKQLTANAKRQKYQSKGKSDDANWSLNPQSHVTLLTSICYKTL